MPSAGSYNLDQTWEENLAAGPRLGPPTQPVPETPTKPFLGFPVRSRLGISAGLLLDGRWVHAYAARGFDLLTYKTVRSAARPSHPWPNWVFVEDTHPPDGPVTVTGSPHPDPTRISSSVCFGMPSVAPEVWREDVRQTVAKLGPGQLLVVSVVGTPGPEPSLDTLADDFAQCANWAAGAGAHVVEANLSCPNVCTAEGTLYQDPVATRTIAVRLREALGRTPLLLKVGNFPTTADQDVFLRTVAGWADGVTLVNGLSRPVLRPDGEPVFGAGFRHAGVLGRAIHDSCVAAVGAARACVAREKLPLQLLAVGGVSTVADIADFFGAGADAVLAGSSPMYLPDLAIEAKQAHPDW